MSAYSNSMNKFLTGAEVGDTLYVALEESEEQSKVHRSVSVYASRYKVTVACKNFFGLSHDFKETIPMVRVTIVSIEGK